MSPLVQQDLLHRYQDNPLITADDIPFTCNTVFNGTPVKVGLTSDANITVIGADRERLLVLQTDRPNDSGSIQVVRNWSASLEP